MRISVHLAVLQSIVFIVTYSEPFCGNNYLTASSTPQYLQSPGYPTHYDNNEDCRWTITASHTGMNVRIVVMDADFEDGSQTHCPYDYVAVYDGSTSLGTSRRTWCSVPQTNIQSSGNRMTLHFHTDGSNFMYRGFKLKYFETAEPSCGNDYLTANSTPQYIQSPGYPTQYHNNEDCRWTITASHTGMNVRIVVMDADFESGSKSSCPYDYVAVYDGSTSLGTPRRKWCSLPFTYIQSSGNRMTLRFHTDDSNNLYRGFKLKYFESAVQVHPSVGPPCENTYLTANATPQYLQSPGYPTQYYKYNCPLCQESKVTCNEDCRWTITASHTGMFVRIVVTDAEFEHGSQTSCPYDYVAMYDGSSTLGSPRRKWCAVPMTYIQSSGNRMTLRLHTDDSNYMYRGFKLKYFETAVHVHSSVGPPCDTTYLTANATPQYLQSPGYPTQYYNNEDCRWTITASHTGMYVRIVVKDANFEGGSQSSCPFDYVAVYDGSSSSSTLRRKWCSVPLTYIQSRGNTMTLRFHTDSSNYIYRGFRLKYFETTEPACGGTVNASRTAQSLTSPNYPGDYDSHSDCTWRVYAPRNTNIQLTMTHFDIEGTGSCTFDSVRIYDGTDSEPSGVGKLCGSTASDYISSENTMTIKFSTDGSTQESGFDFRIQAGDYQVCKQGTIQLSAYTYTENLLSPNYPFSYPNNADCTWLIDTGDRNYIVQIDILQLSLEYAAGCSLDYVEAFDGEDDSASSLGRWCGHDVPIKSSTGRYMFLKFKSDLSNHQGSFKIQYSSQFQLYHSHVNTGAIVGGIIGGIFILVIIIVIVVSISSKRQKPVVTRVPDTRPPQTYMYSVSQGAPQPYMNTVAHGVPQTCINTVSQGALESTLTPAAFSPPPSYSEVTAGTGAPGGLPPYPGVPASAPPNILSADL